MDRHDPEQRWQHRRPEVSGGALLYKVFTGAIVFGIAVAVWLNSGAEWHPSLIVAALGLASAGTGFLWLHNLRFTGILTVLLWAAALTQVLVNPFHL